MTLKSFEMALLGLMNDSERKIICSLSTTKPSSAISRPNNVHVHIEVVRQGTA